MPPSFRLINYSLRPGKSIERKKLFDIVLRMQRFFPIEAYGYSGFGSLYFTDMILAHKMFGIDRIVSMESSAGVERRFEFNKPFKCITIQYGHSNKLLPKLDWSIPQILWLDYDGPISLEVLADIATFTSRALPGSVLSVTVNCAPPPVDKLGPKAYHAHVIEEVQAILEESPYVPFDFGETLLKRRTYHQLPKLIIQNCIDDILRNRNGASGEGDKAVMSKVLDVSYADNVEMLSLGFILHSENQEEMVAELGLEALRTQACNGSTLELRVPRLTRKEVLHLSGNFPGGDCEQIASELGIPVGDVTSFSEIYRQYPNYMEVMEQ